ncbi:UDP-N-acetylmuramate--L-alanine ligase [Aeromicrobium wangtongii]|uniref:UDP-N-acetylmuramate--L-alanine ligase n=1 Tax=Aeromicrobium wangtongii TaxID=2969247 RepID=A0ABY5MEC3_9ACTN|nr:UDP-N-acetylmuramate--L-alanine ligase [Aeromicrobium wangtongii]MCD9197551.1 UDP-N-acetylmuramate--L-alanine ligase [Aeromicrobium wangtongii]UUP15043.1 UDP-N-acetylmuramate--L-alanine ligase [Aeromicrobium wangtongii]
MRIPVPTDIPSATELGHVFFVGIGGAGLSAIARLMAQQGIPVSGSDAHESAVLAALRAEGITCHVGHDAEHLAGVDTVIASTAVRDDNPEIVEAQRRGLRLWPRSAGLRSVMQGRRTIAVAGTHGKTTTTAMLTCALIAAGAEPSFAIGAEVASLGANARLGASDLLVAEADESDGAFLVYEPEGAVVTNVDADHLDNYGTVEAYEAAFDEFVGRVGRFLVLSADDPRTGDLAALARDRGLEVLTAGFGEDADLRGLHLAVEGTTTTFDVALRGVDLGRVELAVPGAHYALDALLALGAGLLLDQNVDLLIAGLGAYTGANRRMQLLGEAGGVRVYDSYAHHPTEIRADLAAARAVAGPDRLVVAYQPHLVSRTRTYGVQMGQALSAADRVVVADIYLAREDADPAVTSALVADAVTGPEATLGGPVAGLADVLVPELRPGDLLLTLGAGDITTVGPAVLEVLGGGR